MIKQIWADNLIQEYMIGKQELESHKSRLNKDDLSDREDITHINSMIDDMKFSLEWLEKGRQPGMYRGIDKKSIYQRQSFEDMDLIPDIKEQLDIDEKHLFISDDEKEVLADIFASFSLRERQCFIRHVGQKKSMAVIADELGVSKSMVQQSIRRANAKVNCRMEEYHLIYA